MKRLTGLSIVLIPVVALLLAPLSGAEEHAYVGTKNCKKCHLKEWKSWSETKMANSFDVLKPGERAEQKTAAGLNPQADYTADPACVKCHTTGYGKEGGFVDVATTPDLVGVGCEMCHGAGGAYTADDKMSLKNKEYKRSEVVAAGMVDKITKEQCVNCHNSESPFVGDDYVFDFDAKKDEGTHEHFPLKYNHDG